LSQPPDSFFLPRPTANRNRTTVVPLFGRVRGGSGSLITRPISMTLFSVAMCDLLQTRPRKGLTVRLQVSRFGAGSEGRGYGNWPPLGKVGSRPDGRPPNPPPSWAGFAGTSPSSGFSDISDRRPRRGPPPPPSRPPPGPPSRSRLWSRSRSPPIPRPARA